MYTEDDLSVLQRVRTLVEEGRSIGEIARMGRDGLLVPVNREASTVEDLAVSIAAAACDLDSATLEALVDEAFGRLSPDRAIQDVIIPAAHEIGRLWVGGRCSIAGEHMASAVFQRYLARLIGSAAFANREAPRVVVACIEGEEHVLGAMVVAYHVGRLGFRVVYLGADLPLEDLGRIVEQDPPASVILSGSAPAVARVMPQLEALGSRCQGRVRCLIGGRGLSARQESLAKAGLETWPEDRGVFELRASDVIAS
jgi:methanogenic corrinoid protein MtbC1